MTSEEESLKSAVEEVNRAEDAKAVLAFVVKENSVAYFHGEKISRERLIEMLRRIATQFEKEDAESGEVDQDQSSAIGSPLLGLSRELNGYEVRSLTTHCALSPAHVFGYLNKSFATRGLQLRIRKLRKASEDPSESNFPEDES